MTKKKGDPKILADKKTFFQEKFAFFHEKCDFFRKFFENVYKFDLGFSWFFLLSNLGFSIFFEWQHWLQLSYFYTITHEIREIRLFTDASTPTMICVYYYAIC